MENTKITKRAILAEIINIMKTGESTLDPAVIITFCENETEQLEKKAAKAKERAATKKNAADPIMDAIQEVLTDEYQIIADLASQIDVPDCTVAKVTNRLTKLVEAGVAEKAEVTVESPTGGKRKVKGYRLVTAD